MMVFKRKEIVAGALVVLIGVAGYLNWSYRDTVRVTDGAEYIETGRKLGTAEYVVSDEASMNYEEGEPASSKSVEDYFEQARAEKENARAKALEILNNTAANESFDEETKKNAQNQILDMASAAEKEAIIENVAMAKGYDKISVYINGDNADLIVEKKDFSEDDVVVLKEIVAQQVNISPSNIKIVQKK